jgi:hypothetical protein
MNGAARRGSARVAAYTLVLYGLVVLLAAMVGVRREAGLATAPSWSVLHLVVVLALALGLLRAQPWARWGAVALSVAALILLMPVLSALVGGPGLTLLIPRLDLALVALQAAALTFLLVLLLRRRGWEGS